VEYYIIQTDVDFGFLVCSYGTCVRLTETLEALKWLELQILCAVHTNIFISCQITYGTDQVCGYSSSSR